MNYCNLAPENVLFAVEFDGNVEGYERGMTQFTLQTLFVTAAIHKSSHSGKFDYSLNFYAKDADELEILLPVNNDALPDYKTMNIYIRAIEKLVIKDVVEYADSKIEATKQVSNN